MIVIVLDIRINYDSIIFKYYPWSLVLGLQSILYIQGGFFAYNVFFAVARDIIRD
jgi:hypothetical protein